jgi:hypothetical protein
MERPKVCQQSEGPQMRALIIIFEIGSHFDRRIDWILAAMLEKADFNSSVESAE